MTDPEKKAEEAAAELRNAVATAIRDVNKAAESFREACTKTVWEEEPYYFVTEALQKLGVGLASLVKWEEDGKGGDE